MPSKRTKSLFHVDGHRCPMDRECSACGTGNLSPADVILPTPKPRPAIDDKLCSGSPGWDSDDTVCADAYGTMMDRAFKKFTKEKPSDDSTPAADSETSA